LEKKKTFLLIPIGFHGPASLNSLKRKQKNEPLIGSYSFQVNCQSGQQLPGRVVAAKHGGSPPRRLRLRLQLDFRRAAGPGFMFRIGINEPMETDNSPT
jgi:hypothetical protein